MSLYKIMIVDDEAEVRQAIARKIDWKAVGFEIVADAENGRDALEKAEALELDVVLTDIKMPFMDGLELGAELSRRKPNLKLIVFSGFDEFEYAKEAIKLNVVEYVLKPVNAAELTAILDRVRRALDAEIEQRRNISRLTQAYQESLPLLREKFLQDLLRGPMDPQVLEAQAERFGLAVREGAYKVAAVCGMVSGAERRPALSAELVPVSVQQMLSDALRDRCRSEIVVGVSSILVATAWERDPVESLMRILGEVCAECERILGVTLTVGIGRPCQKLEELYRSCREARAALEYRAVVGPGKPIYIQDMERLDRTAPEGDSHREQQLLSVIKFGTREQIAAMVDKLLSDGEGEWSDQSRALGMLGTLLSILRRCRLGEEAMLGPRGDWLRLLAEDAPLEELRAWLLSVCLNMSGCMDQRRVSTAKRLVEEAERYIRENYPDSGLSVDRLCDHLHISQSYFSTIFKQETGRSYVQYLTDVRMEHAVELLRTTDDKTYMVAEKVGYDEPNYFSYVFKRRFGVSPSQFRK